MTPRADASASNELDEVDKKVMDRLQRGMPLVHRPFREMAEDVGLSEGEFLDRTRRLVERKLVRRVAPILDVRALGRPTTLVAAAVSEDRIDEVGEMLSQYSGVSHSYRRSAENRAAPYNLWFTLSARDENQLATTLEQMERQSGVKLHNLPAKRIFKIGVQFDIR